MEYLGEDGRLWEWVGQVGSVLLLVFAQVGLVPLSLLSPWQDDQPRAFPGLSGSHGLELPAGMRRKEATVLLAANFTANNRWDKGS